MSRGRATLLLWLVLAVTLIAYAPSLGNRFAMDDRVLAKAVLDTNIPNPMVHELRPVTEYFSRDYLAGEARTPSYMYRPLTAWSYALVYHAFARHAGDDEAREALPQHIVNLLLHLLGVWLSYRVLRLFCGRGPSLLGALVFGLHPIRVEAVANIIGRAEILPFVLGAAALLVYESGARKRGTDRAWRWATSAVLLFLAFCSKESALAWAPFLLVVGIARDWPSRPDARLGSVLRARLPGVLAVTVPPVMLFAVLYARMIGLLTETPPPVYYLMNPLQHEPVTTRIWTATMVWGYGLLKTLWPWSLSAVYGAGAFPILSDPMDWRFLAAFGALAGMLVAGLLQVTRRPVLFVAMATFLGFGFITSNLPLPIGVIFGERHYYTSALALSFVVAWLAGSLAARRARLAGGLVLGAWLVTATVVVWNRGPVWRDNETLFFHDVRVQPNAARLHWAAATLSKDPEIKRRHLEAAVAAFPNFAAAWEQLGFLDARANRVADAERCFRRGIACPPGMDFTDGYDLHYNYALLLIRTGRADQARQHLEAAARLRPFQLGANVATEIQWMRKTFPIPWILKLLEIGEAGAPGAAPWSLHRGMLAWEGHDFRRAERELGKTISQIRARPDLAWAHYCYADSLARNGKRRAAESECERILRREELRQELRARVERLKTSVGG